MDTSKKGGLVIVSGPVGSLNKTAYASNLASAVGHGRVVQAEQSAQALGAVSAEDPPEYPRAWKAQTGVAHETKTRIFVGGVPLEEHERREALPRRKLLAADIPNEPWRASYAAYDLREDGAIVSANVSFELGWVLVETGTVAWARM